MSTYGRLYDNKKYRLQDRVRYFAAYLDPEGKIRVTVSLRSHAACLLHLQT